MKEFTLYWKNGEKDFVVGNSVAEAFSGAGYGAGVCRSLDFFEEGNESYRWILDRWVKEPVYEVSFCKHICDLNDLLCDKQPCAVKA